MENDYDKSKKKKHGFCLHDNEHLFILFPIKANLDKRSSLVSADSRLGQRQELDLNLVLPYAWHGPKQG